MILVVTGGRDYDDGVMIDCVLNRTKFDEIYIGDCPTGVDKFVKKYCENNNIKCTVFKADWDKHGKSAGPIRNKEMLVKASGPFKNRLLIAFPGGKGTNNCINNARSLNFIILNVME